MEEDWYRPGFILYSDGYALKTSDGSDTTIVAGSPTENNYREAVGVDARFESLTGFTQIADTRVVVADLGNSCLRQIDRASGITSVFSGQCESSGYVDGRRGKFKNPWSVIKDNQNSSQVLVTVNEAVRTVEINTGIIGTFVKSDKLYFVRYMVQDLNGDMYLTVSNAIYRVVYGDKSLVFLTGSTRHKGYRDSTLLNSLFHNPFGMFVTAPGSVLVAEDGAYDHIRLVHTNSNRVTTVNLCGDSDCLRIPQSVLLTNDSLYVGQYRKILKFKCK